MKRLIQPTTIKGQRQYLQSIGMREGIDFIENGNEILLNQDSLVKLRKYVQSLRQTTIEEPIKHQPSIKIVLKKKQ